MSEYLCLASETSILHSDLRVLRASSEDKESDIIKLFVADISTYSRAISVANNSVCRVEAQFFIQTFFSLIYYHWT